jgi:hypothetical protein
MSRQDKNPLGFENWQRGENKTELAWFYFHRALPTGRQGTNSGGFIRHILPSALVTKASTFMVDAFVIYSTGFKR